MKMKKLKAFYRTLISVFYPNKCVGCGEIIDNDEFLCNYCYKHIERVDTEKFCVICGMEKASCICNAKIYHFHNIVSVFKNEGIAKRAAYCYKLNHRMQYSRFLAQQICLSVAKLYYGVKFDYVCWVPSSKKSIMKYGFDHTKLLATEISEILNVPLAQDVLGCIAFKKTQHFSSLKERFENVKGKYYFKSKLNADNVLLIDDIRTTAATLDECSKVLMFAGVNRVYCATALTTLPKKKIENQ